MAGTTVRTRIPFGVDSGVVFQLGESLISDQAQAILELVKNSYDAGATYAVVNIVTDQRPPDPTAFGKAVGYIMVSDDGDGMTMNDIKRGWLMIAASAKRDLKREMDKIDEGNRVPLGDKGLGRLSSQRLGNNVEIHTRPVDRDGLSKETHNVAFSWESFRKARSVSQVTAVVESTQGRIAKGTDLVVSGLRDPEYWSGPAQNDLRIRLSQFISPYGGETDFKVSVQFNGTDLELAPLGKSLLSSAQLHFVLDFSGSTLHVQGHVGSNFFRPGSQARTDDRDAYTRYIAIDDGAALIDHILARPQAPKLGFTASPSGQWILNFAYDLPLDRVADAKIKDRVVSPGPFTGEVDAIDVGQSDYEDASTQLSAKQVRDVLAEMAGIRVYRDGFGIRVPKDWLELGKLWTTGTSWYSLRPETTLGRISISARHNSALEEKTDREGFKENAEFRNFVKLLQDGFVREVSRRLSFLGRERVDFIKTKKIEGRPSDAARTPEQAATSLGERLLSISNVSQGMPALKASLQEVAEDANRELAPDALANVSKQDAARLADLLRQINRLLKEAQVRAEQVELALSSAAAGRGEVEVLKDHFDEEQHRLEQMYDLVGLGLSTETFIHEMAQTCDDLLKRNARMETLVGRGAIDPKVVGEYLDVVNSTLASLKRQMGEVLPGLRYQRERREVISCSQFLTDLIAYHNQRLHPESIELSLLVRQEFQVKFNRGRLRQVFLNLILNSEYWILEARRRGLVQAGVIRIEVDRPTVTVADNGEGVPSEVEDSLFDPFVSTKRSPGGRGLGLFIVKEFLRREGCTAILDAKRNKHGRRYRIRLDLSGAV